MPFFLKVSLMPTKHKNVRIRQRKHKFCINYKVVICLIKTNALISHWGRYYQSCSVFHFFFSIQWKVYLHRINYILFISCYASVFTKKLCFRTIWFICLWTHFFCKSYLIKSILLEKVCKIFCFKEKKCIPFCHEKAPTTNLFHWKSKTLLQGSDVFSV